jgi:hypothetical protein
LELGFQTWPHQRSGNPNSKIGCDGCGKDQIPRDKRHPEVGVFFMDARFGFGGAKSARWRGIANPKTPNAKEGVGGWFITKYCWHLSGSDRRTRASIKNAPTSGFGLLPQRGCGCSCGPYFFRPTSR